MDRNKKLIVVVTVVFVLVVGAIASVYFLSGSNNADQSEYSKTVTVSVVAEGRETKTYTIDTDAAYLLDALNEIDLVSGTEGAYGYYITTVDGTTADEQKQEWWMITKDGEMTTTGVSETPIEDGDSFELTLSTY
jgi:hypothetical protein